MEEIWKDVVDFEGHYKVSNLGRVKSVEREVRNTATSTRIVKERILKPHRENGIKYLQVNLSKDNYARSVRVHPIVAKAWIPNPLNRTEINHLDGDKTNNRVDNLEWSTRSENGRHSYRELGRVQWCTGKHGKDLKLSMPVGRFDFDGNLLAAFYSQADAQQVCKLSRSSIRNNCKGKTNQGGGYVWQYLEKSFMDKLERHSKCKKIEMHKYKELEYVVVYFDFTDA